MKQLNWNWAEMLSGLLFITVGGGFLWLGRDLSMGSSYRIGPAYFPTILSVLLLIVGIAVTLRGLLQKTGEALQGVGWRGLVFVLLAIGVFAAIAETAGLFISIFVLSLISALAGREFRLGKSVLLAIGLAVFTSVVFIYLLRLPLPAFPVVN